MKNHSKPLLILDLDETLIHATPDQLNYSFNFKAFHYYIYLRPHVHEFLYQVSQYYQLAIWSSASDDYVHEVIQQLIPTNITLQFVWGRSRCTAKYNPKIDEFGYYHDNYWSHYHYIKPLKKVYKQGYDLKKVLIVDDSPHKVANSYGNAIYSKAFTGQEDDNELLLLLKYLITIVSTPNFRKIEKRFWRTELE